MLATRPESSISCQEQPRANARINLSSRTAPCPGFQADAIRPGVLGSTTTFVALCLTKRTGDERGQLDTLVELRCVRPLVLSCHYLQFMTSPRFLASERLVGRRLKQQG